METVEELNYKVEELRAALLSLMLYCPPKRSNAVALHNAHRVLQLTDKKSEAIECKD